MYKLNKAGTIQFSSQPYKEQREVLDLLFSDTAKKRYLIPIFGRQSGKSWTAKRAAIIAANDYGWRVMWVSAVTKAANRHWQELIDWLEGYQGIKRINRADKEIHFTNGGTIFIRSAHEPDSLRGETLELVILDEWAYYPAGEYLWNDIVEPMLTSTRGKMLAPTTPNGRNYVYDAYEWGLEEDGFYKSWHLPSTKAPYQDLETLLEIKKRKPSRTWRTEYMAEFLGDAGGVFSGVDKVQTVEFLSTPNPDERDAGLYVAGLDVGGSNDASTFTVFNIKTRQQVYGAALEGMDTSELITELIKLIDLWKPRKCSVEINGLGFHLFKMMMDIMGATEVIGVENPYSAVEELFVNYGEWDFDGVKLIPVHVDNAKKRDLVERYATDIAFRRVSLLSVHSPYGKRQAAEMSTYEEQRTSNGVQKTYRASAGNHDDTVTAGYLAYSNVPKPKRFKFSLEGSTQPQTQNPFKSKKARFTKRKVR